MTASPGCVVLMGVAGAGKSTVGARLAERLGVPFLDGDDFHPAHNRQRLASGLPLDDHDREPWLTALGQQIELAHAGGRGLVLACSALKLRYRQRLSAGRPQLVFVHLQVDRDTLVARLRQRQGHFFPPELLDSQLATLEAPMPNEGVLVVDGTATPDQVVQAIVAGLGC